MMLGHFVFGLAAKPLAPKAPLGVLLVAWLLFAYLIALIPACALPGNLIIIAGLLFIDPR